MHGSFEKRDNIGIIRVNNPPVNAINAGVREAIIDGCAKINADPQIKAGILICEGRTFMVGADIREFGKPMQAPSLPDTIQALEDSSKFMVAAIHGSAFGGGLEIALGCHYRVAVADAKVGLPEVKLGLLPGAGGTQRLPRLVGVDAALDIIVSGDPLPAEKAAQLGIIDKILDGDLPEAALEYTKRLVAEGALPRKIRDLDIDTGQMPKDYFEQARQRIAKQKKKLFSPQRIVDALEAAATLPFDKGLKRERDLFMQCLQNSQARALQHVFFAERATSQIPDLDKNVPVRDIESVAVIGAGTMGGGIAMNFLNAGIPVTLLEVKQDALDRGVAVMRKNYESSAAKGRLTMQQVEQRMDLLAPTLSYDDLGKANLIIEAVFETMAIKKEVFGKLDKVAAKGAILASNTSYLSIDEIASSTSRPQDVVGMHFFSPANVMRLCEVVRGKKSAQDALKTAIETTKRIGKVGVVCANSDGFIGNRMLGGYGYQAALCVLEGAMPEQVDSVLRDFGMPMGPMQMSDLAGLDIGYKSRKERDPDSFDGRVFRTADLLVEMGRLGQKTGAGYYDYAPGDRTPRPSPVVAELIEMSSQDFGIVRREIRDEEILERCLLSLVNAGCDVLAEKVANRASDIDIVYIYGYGFPAYRGGPMFWAENEVGLKTALEKLRKYSVQTGGKWLKVSPFLEKLVASGEGFASAGE
ncbi:MAG: 3-hydroxyacyl-CoA dehydrogenase NAD-binding domain-containing protein [Gammaproteobacteria bacterium]|nr:3-hydroxyacyl-CoA dehydrogenase NAD-binding domain-containing protein [Gammaproteobacteria bacterium]MDH4313992.1 3-hydroxyacyl-CoA dehydrogenase NAD-binding domain-containing protein [Gammaproteobacteria bacterium]MDH5212726.1 3-hydroxyacyl-CoA dehydrogenase NAD-binding domain-containing protein [Gammaproteobacteria bacterium]MDH5500970.1 3-hydroxyacyl-CoA dehydrogenase NAD-binding domain-containing protein [Gammaproteobacteria bacterium]